MGEADVELKFGHLMASLRSGCPPHAGFALGVDRLVSLAVGPGAPRTAATSPARQLHLMATLCAVRSSKQYPGRHRLPEELHWCGGA
jgi:hypothetical protein